MPIFEFKCGQCGKEFEELVLSSEPELICPECRSRDVVKLMSACSFRTKGSSGASASMSAPAASGSGCSSCSSKNCSSCG